MQHYKIRIKGKVDQSSERSTASPLHLRVVANEKGVFRLPSAMVTNFTYIYIYIYIYIYHPQTDCFVLSELLNVARNVGGLKPGSKTVQVDDRLSIRPLGQQACHVGLGIIRYYVATATATAAFVCLHFYTLSATRVLNSFEELCIMRAAAEKFLHQSAQPPRESVYIVINRLLSSIRTLQYGSTRRTLEAGIETHPTSR